jgi:hypothetical protein
MLPKHAKFFRLFVTLAASIHEPRRAGLVGPKIKGSHSADWAPTIVHILECGNPSLSRATLLAQLAPFANLSLFTDASDIFICGALQQHAYLLWQPVL